MVKHIILWKLNETLSTKEKNVAKAEIKTGLEGLLGIIPNLLAISVQTECLPSSNADVMLDSTFASVEDLKNYIVHPAHVAVANTKVRPFTQSRLCLDFELN